MSEPITDQVTATADRLANAAEILERVLDKLDSQQQSLNAIWKSASPNSKRPTTNSKPRPPA